MNNFKLINFNTNNKNINIELIKLLQNTEKIINNRFNAITKNGFCLFKDIDIKNDITTNTCNYPNIWITKNIIKNINNNKNYYNKLNEIITNLFNKLVLNIKSINNLLNNINIDENNVKNELLELENNSFNLYIEVFKLYNDYRLNEVLKLDALRNIRKMEQISKK